MTVILKAEKVQVDTKEHFTVCVHYVRDFAGSTSTAEDSATCAFFLSQNTLTCLMLVSLPLLCKYFLSVKQTSEEGPDQMQRFCMVYSLHGDWNDGESNHNKYSSAFPLC